MLRPAWPCTHRVVLRAAYGVVREPMSLVGVEVISFSRKHHPMHDARGLSERLTSDGEECRVREREMQDCNTGEAGGAPAAPVGAAAASATPARACAVFELLVDGFGDECGTGIGRFACLRDLNLFVDHLEDERRNAGRDDR